MKFAEKLTIAVAGIAIFTGTEISSAKAATFFESGDAGDTFDNAQAVSGSNEESLNKIEGTLESTKDKDFFRFFFDKIGNLTIQTGPYSNTPFPSNTFPAFQLFNANNNLVGGYFEGNFTFGIGNLPSSSINFVDGVAELNFSDLLAGEYVLKVDGTGQVNDPKPIYEGNYTISLSDAKFLPSQPVPEPSSLVGIVIASSISWLVKKRTVLGKVF